MDFSTVVFSVGISSDGISSDGVYSIGVSSIIYVYIYRERKRGGKRREFEGILFI